MIRSMTGYGKAEVSIRSKKATIEISAVNNRYLEVSLRLPRIFSEYENEVREAINSMVSRGKLFVTVSFEENGTPTQTLKLNEDVAKLYYKMFRDLQTKFKLAGEISVDHFVGLPELFTVASNTAATKSDVAKFVSGVKKAVDSLNEMRAAEGKALADDMVQRVKKLSKSLELVAKYQPESLVRYRQRLAQRLADVLPEGRDSNLNDEARLRLDMEVALIADKSDVTEECVRLRSHGEAFIAAIKAPGDTGKRLNFILQEMNREANTIGSKSVLYEISSEVIKIREEIEKLREQVQNIE